MKKTSKRLTLNADTIRVLREPDLKQAAGGVTAMCTNGYTVCVCTTDYPNSCPCHQTAQCEPSYHIC